MPKHRKPESTASDGPAPKRKFTLLREALGVKVSDLAEILGITQDMAKRLGVTSKHKRKISPAVAKRLESLYGVAADCLMRDDGGPLVDCSGAPWTPEARIVPSVDFQREVARINAMLGGAFLAAVYSSAAKRQRVGACAARVAGFLSEIEREFGFDSETYEPMRKALDAERVEHERRLDAIQRADFRESAEFKKLNEGGEFVIAGRRVRVRPGMMREAFDSPDGRAEVPEGFWERKGFKPRKAAGGAKRKSSAILPLTYRPSKPSARGAKRGKAKAGA